MKRGFTLIELLAVIVILAIISIIATPIILNIIGDTKESANRRSVENYVVAVNNAIATKQLENDAEVASGTYVTKDGKTLMNIDEPDRVINVDYDGPILEAIITITNNLNIKYNVTSIDNVRLDKTYSSSGDVGMFGDLNSDGVVDNRDKVVIISILHNIGNYSDEVKKAADLNGDGKCDLDDVVILGYMEGKNCYFSDTEYTNYMPGMRSLGRKYTCKVSNTEYQEFYLIVEKTDATATETANRVKLYFIQDKSYDKNTTNWCSEPSTCAEPDTLNNKLKDLKSNWTNLSNYLTVPNNDIINQSNLSYISSYDKNPLKGTAFWLDCGNGVAGAVGDGVIFNGVSKGLSGTYFRPLLTLPSTEVSL